MPAFEGEGVESGYAEDYACNLEFVPTEREAESERVIVHRNIDPYVDKTK